MVHGKDALEMVVKSTNAFFSRAVSEITMLSEAEFLDHFSQTKPIEIVVT